MEPSNPWLRFFVGIVCAAIAIRVAIDVIRPVFGLLLVALALVGAVLLVRWWRNGRW
ncbi:MAG TPA: hypothetical protein VHS03_08355 [Gaiellaceae bacterium]|jgi:hypothetical protein|nr:hypothetical protein [Gaiellaceae bacterium]